jgi:hypothetical protein
MKYNPGILMIVVALGLASGPLSAGTVNMVDAVFDIVTEDTSVLVEVSGDSVVDFDDEVGGSGTVHASYTTEDGEVTMIQITEIDVEVEDIKDHLDEAKILLDDGHGSVGAAVSVTMGQFIQLDTEIELAGTLTVEVDLGFGTTEVDFDLEDFGSFEVEMEGEIMLDGDAHVIRFPLEITEEVDTPIGSGTVFVCGSVVARERVMVSTPRDDVLQLILAGIGDVESLDQNGDGVVDSADIVTIVNEEQP